MRDLIVTENITLDGVIDAAGGWFGPAGTEPAHRGKKLGEALLVRCLEDVRGLPEAGVIAWIGPKQFYAKARSAVDDRRFVTMERE